MNIIDFSGHDAWLKCPALWYEKYVNRRRKRWPKAQRDDALALGSLVHEGLRVWQQSHTVEIPQAVIEEMTPTKECFELAQELVWGYARAYPEERWPLIVCEEPVVFPLITPDATVWACSYCGETGRNNIPSACPKCNSEITVADGFTPRLDGLAKIDSYFYVPEYTEIESGLPGLTQTLQPGWWIHEYKTKSPFIEAGLYMQSWGMGLQASYQMMALGHHISNDPAYDAEAYPVREVQGVLVNVLEKPRRHVPRRKCQRCEETYEFATWVPTGTGLYACPVCGNRQKLTPLKEGQPQIPPTYYRIVVTRTAEELARDRREIIQVGQRMQEMERGGLYSEPWAHQACVDFRWRKACDYFGNHRHFTSTSDDPDFEHVPDYRGLTQIEEVA